MRSELVDDAMSSYEENVDSNIPMAVNDNNPDVSIEYMDQDEKNENDMFSNTR